MDVEIEHIGEDESELVLIRCRAVTEEVREIADFVKSRQGRLVGVQDSMRYGVPLPDVHYIESVDGRTFLYTKDRAPSFTPQPVSVTLKQIMPSIRPT